MSNIVIIGSGPAGVSAALYTARAGVDTTVLTRGPGALDRAEGIQNYYGFAAPISGAELERQGIKGAKAVGVKFVTTEAVGLTYTDKLTVETLDGDYPADAVILATGAARAVPRIPGLAGLEGHGVSYCATCDAFFYRGRDVAVVGSGPAGLATANQLNRRGYDVTVFERREAVGGLLRFGIPNFKLNKAIIDRRVDVMKAEGITFEVNADIDILNLPRGFDAYAVCTGTPQARDLNIPGRDLNGVHFALDLLSQQNRVLAGQTFSADERVTAKGKRVLVIGGGDTGSDCIGTSIRQGAVAVTQIEIMPKPPVGNNPATPWPQWPQVLRTSSSHEEGCERRWCLSSTRFIGKDNNVIGVEVEEVEWTPNPEGGRPLMKPTSKKEVIDADLVLLAMGFLKPQQPELPDNVFVAGDAATGASLVVRCIAAGRQAAADIDKYLKTKQV